MQYLALIYDVEDRPQSPSEFEEMMGGYFAFNEHSKKEGSFLGGEALVEVRGLWLDGPVGEVGWTGNLGGLAAGLGWRVLY